MRLTRGMVFPGDVWSFTSQALTAYLPSPVDKASPVSPALTLWLAGVAALKHHLYLAVILMRRPRPPVWIRAY
jgi:hypothetical protein